MLTTEISSYLDDFDTSSNKIRSILFEGKWGCGKTYNIFKYIEEHNPNYVYVSLFGTTSINDVIIKLSEKIDSSYIVNIDKNYYIDISAKKSIAIEKWEYNGGIIIIDDIERKSGDLLFKEVCGLISSLVMNGFKVICIMNDEELVEKNYFGYIEKTFDKDVKVYGDAGIIQELVGKDLKVDDSVFNSADGNFRLILRGKSIFDEIKHRFNEIGNPISKIDSFNTPTVFLRCIIIALRCKHWKDEDLITIEMDRRNEFNLKKFEYDAAVSEFGVSIANGIYNIFYVENENHNLLSDVKLILKFLEFGKYDDLIAIENNDVLAKEPFCNEFYYLDDDEKEYFLKELIRRINEFDLSKDKYLNVVLNCFKYSVSDVTDEMLEIVVNQMVNSVDIENEDLLLADLKDHLMMARGEYEQQKIIIEKILNMLEEKLKDKNKESMNDALKEAFNSRNYSNLIDYLYKNKRENNAELIADEFAKKNYFLPDLSKRLDYSSWTYCHEIARFVSPFESHRVKFMDVLVEQCYHSNSKSLRDRCNALTKYNFNENFDEYLESKKSRK